MVKSFKQFFNESTDPNFEIWYHGDTTRRTTFKNQNMDRDWYEHEHGANENGPGIYFTRSLQEALSYSNQNGYIYEVKLNVKNFLTDKQKVDKKKLLKLIDWCPDERKEIGLSNFDDNPQKALKMVLDTYSNWPAINAYLAIYKDFYGNSEANEWVNSMMNLGFDDH